MVKKSKSYLFDPVQYGCFRKICRNSGLGVTEAFERFMKSCIDADRLVYVEAASGAVEAEARVLVSWLECGKLLYRNTEGTELNVSGRLLDLLPHVSPALAQQIEAVLKRSVQKESV